MIERMNQDKELDLLTETAKTMMEQSKYPNPAAHQMISFLKSGVRITGYVALLYSLSLGVFILIISEAIGILEELV
jgi:hypothetical protein